MKIAQILNGRAHWIFEAEGMPQWAPNIVLIDITDVVPAPQEGWLFDGATFTPPPIPPLKPIPAEVFLDLFTDTELEAIEALAKTNQKAAVFLRRLTMRRVVSSSDPRIISAMTALENIGILTPTRKTEILQSFG